MKHLLYLKDVKKFYDPTNPKGGPITQSTALKRLKDLDPKYSDEVAAMRELAEAMECGVNWSDIKEQKKAASVVNFAAIYEALAPLMPIMFKKTVKGQTLAFVVSENKEVTKIEYQNEDNLKDALMHPNRAHIWAAIRDFYSNSELLEGHRDKLHFGPFIMMMIKNWLLYDERKILTEDPVQISWNEDEYAYKKMNLNLLVNGDTPTWDEFLNRLDYPEVFKAWIWSIFESTNNLRQIMWLRGAGNDGKSSVQKAIEQVIGQDYCYSMKEGDEERQWFQNNVYTKVLVNYADCKNMFLIQNSAIKQLTGGDTTSIEGKGENAFTGKIYSKLFVTSNVLPKINPELRAHTSRIIKLEVDSLDDDKKDAGFEKRLIAEIYPFLWQCKTAYEKYASHGHDKLILPQELQEKILVECASESHMYIMDFIEGYIEFGANNHCKASDLNKQLREFLVIEKHLAASQVKHYEEQFKQKVDGEGCIQRRIETGGKLQTVFIGFKLKEVQK